METGDEEQVRGAVPAYVAERVEVVGYAGDGGCDYGVVKADAEVC